MFKDIKQNTKRSGTLQKIGNVLSLERLEDTSEQIFNQMLEKKYKKILSSKNQNGLWKIEFFWIGHQ